MFIYSILMTLKPRYLCYIRNIHFTQKNNSAPERIYMYILLLSLTWYDDILLTVIVFTFIISSYHYIELNTEDMHVNTN